MKSYISRKLPLETRTTDQILDLRSAGVIIWTCLKRSFTLNFHARKGCLQNEGVGARRFPFTPFDAREEIGGRDWPVESQPRP